MQANAPRGNRDGGYVAPVTDYSADHGGGYGAESGEKGGDINWADDANDQAAWEKPAASAPIAAEGGWDAGGGAAW